MIDRVLTGSTRAVLLLLVIFGLTGCGAAAAPCRIGSAALKIIPAIGHTLAEPTDSCASAIDPTPAEP
jgi:Family of unknown function (DUF6726)